jgi:monoamine oxidase
MEISKTNEPINRRDFLKLGIAAAAATGFGIKANAAVKRVIVLGAGLSGLSAALELANSGFDVTILEARARPGGRVYTLREPFSDGLYAEAGAARIQDSHEFTLRYVKEFKLELDPFFPTEGASVTYIKGKRIVSPFGKRPAIDDLPLTFSEEEKKLGLLGSQAKYLFSHLAKLGDGINIDWSSEAIKELEVALPDFLRKQGASDGMIQMFGLGHDLSAMSALMLLRDAALGAKTKLWYKIRGGNDQLPKALAAKLSDKIEYGAEVRRIEQDERGVRAIFIRADAPHVASGDYLVNTIPLSVMRRIDVSPMLSEKKRAAIQQIEYFSMARVHLQSKRRFWLERGENGFATSDDPLDVWDYTRHQPGKRGILGAYLSGRMGQRLCYQTAAEREDSLLEMMERIHPGIRENFETSASHCWLTDPWNLGAGAEFRAGQMTAFAPYLALPEGRIHFAGDHTSPWNGWMNGALESGNRAAAEIKARG